MMSQYNIFITMPALFCNLKVWMIATGLEPKTT